MSWLEDINADLVELDQPNILTHSNNNNNNNNNFNNCIRYNNKKQLKSSRYNQLQLISTNDINSHNNNTKENYNTNSNNNIASDNHIIDCDDLDDNIIIHNTNQPKVSHINDNDKYNDHININNVPTNEVSIQMSESNNSINKSKRNAFCDITFASINRHPIPNASNTQHQAFNLINNDKSNIFNYFAPGPVYHKVRNGLQKSEIMHSSEKLIFMEKASFLATLKKNKINNNSNGSNNNIDQPKPISSDTSDSENSLIQDSNNFNNHTNNNATAGKDYDSEDELLLPPQNTPANIHTANNSATTIYRADSNNSNHIIPPKPRISLAQRNRCISNNNDNTLNSNYLARFHDRSSQIEMKPDNSTVAISTDTDTNLDDKPNIDYLHRTPSRNRISAVAPTTVISASIIAQNIDNTLNPAQPKHRSITKPHQDTPNKSSSQLHTNIFTQKSIPTTNHFNVVNDNSNGQLNAFAMKAKQHINKIIANNNCADNLYNNTPSQSQPFSNSNASNNNNNKSHSQIFSPSQSPAPTNNSNGCGSNIPNNIQVDNKDEDNNTVIDVSNNNKPSVFSPSQSLMINFAFDLTSLDEAANNNKYKHKNIEKISDNNNNEESISLTRSKRKLVTNDNNDNNIIPSQSMRYSTRSRTTSRKLMP